MTRVLVVADSHLSVSRAYAQHNWDRLVEYVAESRPDLVVHVGDLVLDSPDVAEDREHCRRQLDRIGPDVLVVPGNHDIGDSAPEPWQGEFITEERLAPYRDTFGPDAFLREVGGWTLVGLNAQLLGTGLSGEQAQWEILERVVAQDGPCVLFLHKPPFFERPDERGDHDTSILERARRRLVPLVEGRFALVVSGHLHVYRELDVGGTRYVWAPTTALIALEELGTIWHGICVNGCVELDLQLDGTYATRLLVPPGFRPVDYAGVAADVPRGSRFLPPLPLAEAVA